MRPDPILTDADIAQLRAQADSTFRSRVNVWRRTGRGPQNSDDGLETDTWVRVHEDLPFRLRVSRLSGGSTKTVDVGGVEMQYETSQGRVPARTQNLRDNDYIEVVSGEWPDTVWRIIEATRGDWMSSRRFPVIEVARPGEWG